MDLKKFLDQTVREVKREVNKKVLKVPEIEQKVYEATSNEPWGPHGTLMGDIAQATRNYGEYQMIMAILWKRLNDTGRNWRHVYKSLTVLEFLVANGAERIIDELREHAYQVQTLVDFQYMEAGGKDQGINVRKKAQTLVGLLSDKEKIREVRAKAAANRDKYRGVSSTGSFSKSGSYSSTGGGYGGDSHRDEDRYGGSSRSGRDDDRYGGDRDRDREERYRDEPYKEDRYRDDDRSTRDTSGDRYRDDRDRDRFEDDRYGSKGGDGYNNNDKYSDDVKSEGSASGYGKDRDRDRSFEEDDRYPPRRGSGSGSKADDYGQDEREPNGLAAAVARAHTSQTNNLSQTSSNASQGGEKKPAASVGGSYFASMPTAGADDFDDFDPRGTGAVPRDDDAFGASASAPAPVSVPAPSLPPVKTTSGIEDLFGDSGFETSFNAVPAPESNTTVQGNDLQSEDLFGEPAFSAVQPSTTSFPTPPPSAPTSFPAPMPAQTSFPAPPPAQTSFQPATNVSNGNFRAFDESNSSFGASSFPAAPPANSASMPSTFLPPPPPPPAGYSSTNSFQTPSGPPTFPLTSGSSSQVPYGHGPLGGTPYGQSAITGLVSSQAPPTKTYAPPSKPQQRAFQTKSAIWNDTISSGLVDLNISGPKTNPLAELGIDLKDSIFSAAELRKKEEKAQPTASNMGRAMGSGTGRGLAGAGGIAPPPAPSMMGGMNMGMGGMGMGVRQPAMGGMGMGVNTGYMGNPGMAPNVGYSAAPGMGINPGFGISPGMGMTPGMGQGMGMNPGMAGYGQGVGMVQGGYATGMGMGGYPNQQYSGYR
ncbi:unnamed protein product [Calypogeia fissa]